MGIQQDIETLAKSLRKNGFASSDVDAVRMAERMLGVSKHIEQRFQEKKEFISPFPAPAPKIEERPVVSPVVKVEEKPEEEVVKLEDIEPIQQLEILKNSNTEPEPVEELEPEPELESGFKEIKVEKKERPSLTKEEREKADLSKLFYFGNK